MSDIPTGHLLSLRPTCLSFTLSRPHPSCKWGVAKYFISAPMCLFGFHLPFPKLYLPLQEVRASAINLCDTHTTLGERCVLKVNTLKSQVYLGLHTIPETFSHLVSTMLSNSFSIGKYCNFFFLKTKLIFIEPSHANYWYICMEGNRFKNGD